MTSGWRYPVTLFLVSLPLLAFVPGATAAPLTVTCNGGACSPDWYKVNITVAFAWDPVGVTSTSGCDTQTISSDTSGRHFHCVVNYGGTPATQAVADFDVKRDATAPTVTGGSPTRGPDSNGWYNHPVGINFNGSDATSGLAGCNSTTYGGPDSASASFSGTCTDQAGNVSAPASFGPIQYDGSPPSVSVALSRGPDSGGWYNHPVDFQANGSDNLSGIASCSSGSFGGGGAVSASCSDKAGNVGTAGVGVNYDAGAPSIDSITFDRSPDSNGWYNHPVRVTFHGSDGGSGIDSCTDVTYPGPDTNGTAVNGTCTDKAGNRAGGTSAAFKYDATPPTITNLGFDWDDGTATLTWTASPDTKAIEIDRTPGTAGPDPSAVFKGLASSFEDRGLTNKVKYLYTINGFDDAGNKASESLSIVPGAKLYSPARGSVVTSLPLLAWRPVAGASYYNLQVYYGVGKALRRVASLTVSGRKVMSVWPLQPRYRMKKTWKYKGKVRKLALGHYRWYVYPGTGKRTAHKYGPLIGQSDFFVAKKR
ncbi:MAG: hypothetical protein V7645_800 [Actinomycetota bacterium]